MIFICFFENTLGFLQNEGKNRIRGRSSNDSTYGRTHPRNNSKNNDSNNLKASVNFSFNKDDKRIVCHYYSFFVCIFLLYVSGVCVCIVFVVVLPNLHHMACYTIRFRYAIIFDCSTMSISFCLSITFNKKTLLVFWYKRKQNSAQINRKRGVFTCTYMYMVRVNEIIMYCTHTFLYLQIFGYVWNSFIDSHTHTYPINNKRSLYILKFSS